jgi:hypothetical protein
VEKGLLTQEDGLSSLKRLQSYGRFKDEILEEVARQIGGTYADDWPWSVMVRERPL